MNDGSALIEVIWQGVLILLIGLGGVAIVVTLRVVLKLNWPSVGDRRRQARRTTTPHIDPWQAAAERLGRGPEDHGTRSDDDVPPQGPRPPGPDASHN